MILASTRSVLDFTNTETGETRRGLNHSQNVINRECTKTPVLGKHVTFAKYDILMVITAWSTAKQLLHALRNAKSLVYRLYTAVKLQGKPKSFKMFVLNKFLGIP